MSPKIRVAPRISVTKLAEFLDATPTRRRTIVLDAKFPPDFKSLRYRVPREVTTAAICASDSTDLRELFDAGRRQLTSRRARSRWDAQDIESSLLALQRSLQLLGERPFAGLEATRGPNFRPKLVIESVQVSVRPDVLLAGPKGAGGVLLYFSKNSPLTPLSAQYAAVLLCEHLRRVTDRVAPQYCAVIDVFDQTITYAPRAYMRRRREVAEACREIVMRWDNP